jgi:hypothetical protein
MFGCRDLDISTRTCDEEEKEADTHEEQRAIYGIFEIKEGAMLRTYG